MICSKRDLKDALSKVTNALPTRTTSPVLEGILIKVSDGKMQMTCSNMVLTIETVIEVNGNIDSVIVPGRLFKDVISILPDDNVEIVKKRTNLIITSGSSQSKIACMRSDDYPEIKIEEPEESIIIPGSDLKTLIKKTAFSASNDDFNGVLTGVLLETENNEMRMVGVDPFRMGMAKVPINYKEKVSSIIPAGLITNAARILPDDDIKIDLGPKVVINYNNTKIVMNTLAGKFIDYKRLLTLGDIEVNVNKDSLLKAIEYVSVLGHSENLVKFEVFDNELKLTCITERGELDENIPVDKKGKDLEIGLNSQYLRAALKAIEDNEIKLVFSSQDKPCFIRPITGNEYLYLILPIRLRG